MTVELSILVAIIGCFIGLAGWLSGRDKKIAGDAEWRGMINAKLDVIVGIKEDLSDMDTELRRNGERLTSVEETAKSTQKRLDEHISGR